MRWRLGREHGTCPTCGAALDPDAVWCGSCGAAVAAARAPEETHPADPPEPPGDRSEEVVRPPRRRFLLLVAVLAVVAVAVAVLRPDPPPEPLLGQVGAVAGLSATGPPPTDLRLAWEAHRPPGTVTDGVWGLDVAAADGRVRVGPVVVDLDSGRVVRRAASDPGAGLHRVEHTAGELLVVDTLTGSVVDRSPLEAPPGSRLRARARSGEVTLLSDGNDTSRWEDGGWVAEQDGAGRSLVVRDSGDVVVELDGTLADSDRAVGDPASFPVRAHGAVRLVAAATGEVVAELTAPAGDLLVVDVVGDLALVATTSRQLPGPETGVPWEVELVNARTGQPQRQLVMQSAEPPRLLGFLTDGTTVLSTRSGREVAVRGIGPDGRLGPIAQVTTGVPSVIDAPAAEGSALLATVGVSGGVAVGLDARRGLLGYGLRGNVLWQADAPDGEVLAAGDGFVAAIPHPQAERVLVVDANDGSAAATISRGDAGLRVVTIPVAVLDGHVGMARVGRSAAVGDLSIALGVTTWLDLHTGELTGMQEFFAPYAGGDPGDVGADWLLYGVLPRAGDGEPVVTRQASRTALQVLDPREGFVTFELPSREEGGVAAFVPDPVGASATHLVVSTRGFEEPSEVATHLLDRASGEVTTVTGVAGVALVGDLLLAVELDQLFEVTALVGMDAATGEQLWRSDSTPVVGTTGPPSIDRHRADAELMVTAAAFGVEAVSLRDGSRRWSHASDVELTPEQVVLGPRQVVVAATDGVLVALDREDGGVVWRTALGAPVASMTGAGGHTLVGTHDGLVIHLDSAGREVQRIAVGTEPVLGVAALGEMVVAVVGDAVVGLRADGTGITREDEVELP